MLHAELTDIIQLARLQYGYDLTGYTPASLKRRIERFMGAAGIGSVFELKHSLVNDEALFTRMTQYITVNVTEMFRDPPFYETLRRLVLPRLAEYPLIKVWHAGCATGEEVFSMAIWLHEAGLLQRARIYATDLNMMNLEKAKAGIIPLERMKQYTQNYMLAGGTAGFSGYYTARYANAIISRELRRRIVFFRHNLAADGVFGRFQLVCCRNVFIYFNQDLQNHALQLFHESLLPGGFLALGSGETLRFSGMQEKFETVDTRYKIYRHKQ